MKYIFVFIGWVILAAWLIFNYAMKTVISFLTIIWNFRFKKEDHFFWTEYLVYIPPVFFVKPSLKDYFMGRFFKGCLAELQKYDSKYYDSAGEIKGGILVNYKGHTYITGNRGHELVDLMKNGEFVMCVRQDEIKIVKKQPHELEIG